MGACSFRRTFTFTVARLAANKPPPSRSSTWNYERENKTHTWSLCTTTQSQNEPLEEMCLERMKRYHMEVGGWGFQHWFSLIQSFRLMLFVKGISGLLNCSSPPTYPKNLTLHISHFYKSFKLFELFFRQLFLSCSSLHLSSIDSLLAFPSSLCFVWLMYWFILQFSFGFPLPRKLMVLETASGLHLSICLFSFKQAQQVLFFICNKAGEASYAKSVPFLLFWLGWSQ